jgi:hypothetical protein
MNEIIKKVSTDVNFRIDKDSENYAQASYENGSFKEAFIVLDSQNILVERKEWPLFVDFVHKLEEEVNSEGQIK